MADPAERPRSDAHRSNVGGADEDRAVLDDIFKAGRRARRAGTPLRDNPYAAGSVEREEWHAGWSATVEIDEDGAPDCGYQKN